MPAGRTNALLQKVNSQLRGERVPLKTKEEDELAVYLQSIAQKTQQARTVGFEDYGDISISSGVQSVTPRGQRKGSPVGSATAPASSKFLKKKKTTTQEDENDIAHNNENNDPHGKGILLAGKKKDNDVPSKAVKERHAAASALDKANALTKKITSWSSRNQLRHRHQSADSETDESVKGSEVGKRPGSADTSIGRDGNKFLKSSKGLPRDSKVDIRTPSPQLNYQRSLSQEKMEVPAKGSKTKGEIVRTLGSVYLTSEEESLAEFIHGLSASESLKKPQNLVTKKQQKWRKKSPSPSGPPSPSIHMSRSPSPFKNQSPSPYGRLSRSQSQDSDLVESMASEILEIKQRPDDSASSGDRFGVNLMDISSLLPADSSPVPVEKNQKKTKKKNAQGKKSQSSSTFAFKPDRNAKTQGDSKRRKQKETNASSSKNQFFESLGIQMVDDIFDTHVEAKAGRESEISVSDDSEIKTEKSDNLRKSRLQRQESASDIITELGSRSKTAHKSEEDVISERIGDESSLTRSESYSSIDNETEADDDYSETFVSESETLDQRRSKRSELTERDDAKTSRRKVRDRKVVLEEKSVDITTADVHGNTHHFNTTQIGVTVAPSYGLQYVDPTPVCAHVINPDALEALTAYSPNMIALQDMMRSQLQLVTSFMDIQKRIYKSCLDGLSEEFQYTTLEDTKEYIRKNRKARMTFDEALKFVDVEEKNI